jgi:hypothetical protein
MAWARYNTCLAFSAPFRTGQFVAEKNSNHFILKPNFLPLHPDFKNPQNQAADALFFTDFQTVISAFVPAWGSGLYHPAAGFRKP